MSENNKHFDIAEIKATVRIWHVLRHFGHDCPERCIAIKSPTRDEKRPSFSIFADGKMAKDHATGESFDVILLYEALAGCNRHDAITGCGKLAGLAPGEVPPEMSVPPPPRSSLYGVNVSKGSKLQMQRVTLREKLGEFTEEKENECLERALCFLDSERDINILKRFAAGKLLSPEFMRKMIYQRLIGVLKHPALREPAIAFFYDNPIYGKACKLRFGANDSHRTMWWHGRSNEHYFGEQLVQPVTVDEQPNGETPAKMFVVEGESDTLTMLQLDLPVIGVPGARVRPCFRLTYRLLAFRIIGVWLDSDKAGREATKDLQEWILQHASGSAIISGIGSKVPDGLDIGDCWLNWGERFRRYTQSELDRLQIYKEIPMVDIDEHHEQ